MQWIKKKDYNIAYLGVFLILVIGFVLYTFKWFRDLKGFESKTFGVVFVTLIMLMVITVVSLIKFNKGDICKQFLVIALIWGSAFVVINPPYYVPDESVHVYRSYDLAKGRLFFEGSKNSMMLPSGVIEHDSAVWRDAIPGGFKQYLQDMKIPLQKDRLVEYNADPTGAYNTIAYIPQSIGLFIGNLLNLPAHFVFLLGRFSNLFTWIALCYLALKIIPIKKELLFMLIFMPIGVQQAASFSPDALLNSSSFLLIAYILYLKFEKTKVNIKDYAVIIMLTVIIGAIKIPYIVIGGLLILIPNKKMNLKVFSKVLVIIMILVVNIGIGIGWKKISAPIVSNSYEVVQQVEGAEVNAEVKEEMSPKDVIKNVISEPYIFSRKVARTLKHQGEFYKYSMTTNFGWFKLLGPEDFMNLLIVVILLFAIKGDEKDYKLNWFDKSIFTLMTIGMYITLCLVSLVWQGVPVNEIDIFGGIQGRYFFPFIIGILLVLQNTKLRLRISGFWINSFRNLYVCWVLAFSVILIFNGYFIFR